VLPELTSRIIRQWNDLFPGVDRPTVVRYLGIPGSVEGGTTTFLAFADKKTKPIFAVKLHRYPDVQERALNESDILDRVGRCGSAISTSVPRVILCERISGVWVLVQSVVDGRPMVAAMTAGGEPEIKMAARNMQITVDWLVQLQKGTVNSLEIDQGQLVQNELKTIRDFSATFDLSATECIFLEEIATALSTTFRTNGFIQHGDFCRQNILVTEGPGCTKVGVIDWTDAQAAGFPLHDLLYFITTYCLQTRKYTGVSGVAKTFTDTFFEPNIYSTLVRRCIIDYCTQVELHLSTVKTLFAIFLVNQTMFEYNKMATASILGGLPTFTMYLASYYNQNYDQALKQQLWIYFFREAVKLQNQFIL
jgi:hypothetical protein